MISRRGFLAGLAAGGLVGGSAARPARAVGGRPGRLAFLHGVASGDPEAERVVLWTRVTPERPGREVAVQWRLSDREDLGRTVQSGRVLTGPELDYTVKVVLDGLEPGGVWHYAFEAGGDRSPVGRTRTLPADGLRPLGLAVVSCSNYPAGYFNTYADIAGRPDVDAVIHLGDYIYEYGLGEYATEHAAALGRIPDPEYETVSLADYRRRHAQYKTDTALQAVHARLPLIAIWDDHELTNDAWLGGAQNHQETEGDWQSRREAALRAYDEWMPVAPLDTLAPGRFRQFRFGDLADLFLLDTRVEGRDRQVSSPKSRDEVDGFRARLAATERQLLGGAQERWLAARIDASGARWQLLAQQVMVAPMLTPDLRGVIDVDGAGPTNRDRLESVVEASALGLPLLLDTWDGYPAARTRLYDMLRRAANPLVLSGDLHSSLHNELIDERDGKRIGQEFVTPAVSSPGLGTFLRGREPGGVERAILARNPHLRYLDLHRNGWLHLSVAADGCRAEWRHVSTVLDRRYEVATGYRAEVDAA